MTFSSVSFLFMLLPPFLAAYLLLPGKPPALRRWLIIAASLVFYAWSEGPRTLVPVAVAFAAWLCGILGASFPRARKAIAATAAVVLLAVLAVFKYSSFGMPLGISFFTFSALSYIIDTCRDPELTERNAAKVLLYIIFFPKLVQGPIAKYRDFAAADGTAQVSAERTCRGIRRFALGLFKKLFLADILAIAADRIFADSGLYTLFLPAWLGAVSYLLQLYFDFSGYTDMALGLAAMLGYELPENFRYPYAACGMRDFWRRWHISLSAWFTDYVYIPLGGSRRSRAVTCRNIVIVFFLTGILHGSAATFIAWGLLNGVFVMLEHIGVIRADSPRLRPLIRIYTALAVTAGFVIFRSPSLGAAGGYLAAMLSPATLGAHEALEFFDPRFAVTLLSAAVFAMPVLPTIKKALSKAWYGKRILRIMNAASYVAVIPVTVLSAAALAANSYTPFLYARF